MCACVVNKLGGSACSCAGGLPRLHPHEHWPCRRIDNAKSSALVLVRTSKPTSSLEGKTRSPGVMAAAVATAPPPPPTFSVGGGREGKLPLKRRYSEASREQEEEEEGERGEMECCWPVT